MIALQKQDIKIPFEIIVVNTASTDNTTTIGEKYGATKVLTIKKRNPYTARNLGIQKAEGEYIAFLDAKCCPRPDWLRKMTQCSMIGDTNIIAGHFHVEQQKNTKDCVFAMLYLINKRNVQYNYGVPAGNLMVRKSIFADIGKFRDYNISGNDIEWSRRAMQLGEKIAFCEEAVVDYPSKTFDDLIRDMQKYGHGASQLMSSNKKIRAHIKSYFPMKPNTFLMAINFRNYQFLPHRLLVLYFWVWRAKRYYGKGLYEHK